MIFPAIKMIFVFRCTNIDPSLFVSKISSEILNYTPVVCEHKENMIEISTSGVLPVSRYSFLSWGNTNKIRCTATSDSIQIEVIYYYYRLFYLIVVGLIAVFLPMNLLVFHADVFVFLAFLFTGLMFLLLINLNASRNGFHKLLNSVVNKYLSQF